MTNYAAASEIADQRRAALLRDAHHARLAGEALRRHRAIPRSSMHRVRLRGGAGRIAAPT